ncbi:MAG: UPF0175 family protein [Candidatus Tectomicrobia bacterium]|uniref:UPF0175 family protein n=1 Tax=Tectimicrobiota bacterium TaxID=2528274 RepID=A0A932GR84_UNCTE|nr:UPF0175 family protein [Candidatus Tectomicrobia bacterium]
MPIVHIEIPEETLISLKQDPESFSQDLRLLAAVKLFELGKLSSGRAAQLAGMSRVEFLEDLRASGLWISEELMAIVLAQTGESSGTR